MFTPPFRAVLLKSIGLAILVVIFGIGLHRLLGWLAGIGEQLEGVPATGMATPLHALLWVLAILAGFGLVAGAVFLMPAVTAFVASFFSDEIAAEVERVHYPADPPGARAAARARALIEGVKTGAAGAGRLSHRDAVRAVRRARLSHPVPGERLSARPRIFRARRDALSPGRGGQGAAQAHRATIFTAGLFIAAFVSIPILNLATPLFGTALMVHMHKRLAGRKLAAAGVRTLLSFVIAGLDPASVNRHPRSKSLDHDSALADGSAGQARATVMRLVAALAASSCPATCRGPRSGTSRTAGGAPRRRSARAGSASGGRAACISPARP